MWPATWRCTLITCGAHRFGTPTPSPTSPPRRRLPERHERGMSGVGQVAAWAPGPLTTAQARVAVAEALVSDAGSVLATQAALAANWSGDAAQAAAAQHAELSARLDGLGDALHRLEPALERAADRLALLVAMVRLAEVASMDGGSALVGRDGPRESAAAVALADEIDAELAAAFAEAIGRLGSLTEPRSRSTGSPGSAGSAASGGWAGVGPLVEAAAGPRAAARLGTAVLLAAVPSPPPGGDLVAWWNGLSAVQRESAVTYLPEVVGPNRRSAGLGPRPREPDPARPRRDRPHRRGRHARTESPDLARPSRRRRRSRRRRHHRDLRRRNPAARVPAGGRQAGRRPSHPAGARPARRPNPPAARGRRHRPYRPSGGRGRRCGPGRPRRGRRSRVHDDRRARPRRGRPRLGRPRRPVAPGGDTGR